MMVFKVSGVRVTTFFNIFVIGYLLNININVLDL